MSAASASSRVPAQTGPALEAAHLSKHFGQVKALIDARIAVDQGEVLGLVGDNGAGKSTLVKVLTGIYKQDEGMVAVHGQPVNFGSPADAHAAGIASVYQDLALVEVLDVATNMFLGQMPRRGCFVDRGRMDREAKQALDELGVAISSVRTPVGVLSGGQRQMVAIARAVRAGVKVILLDEPTAALGVRETSHVKEVIRGLGQRGAAVMVVCHDMELVFDICNRVQVMRLGRVAGIRRIADTTRDEVVGLITGAVSDTTEVTS